MWDVHTREKPILPRQLVGDIEVYTTGAVQLECPNDSGGTTVVSLLETCYIPDAKVNLFNLQKLRKALYVIEQGDKLGTQWVRNPDGEVMMGMKEVSEGRAVIDCTILLPDRGRGWRRECGQANGGPREGEEGGEEVGSFCDSTESGGAGSGRPG